MILSQNLRKGTVFIYRNDPWLVQDYKHIKMARADATIRVKIKNIKTGTITEETFNSSEKFEEAHITNKNFQFLYKDDNNLAFMDPDTYEQRSFKSTVISDQVNLLKEGEEYQLMIFEDNLVKVVFPKTMNFKVKYTEPGHKGDTQTAAMKPAELENGIEVKVPLFINIGDTIRINTDTMEYKERASKS